MGGLEVVLGPFERLARRDALGPQIFLPREVLLPLVELHFRRLDRLPHLFERALGGLKRRAAVVHARAQRPRVDLQQELPFRDGVAFIHGEVDDAPGGFRGDVDETLGLDLAGRRHNRFEIARFDRFDGDDERRLPLEVEVRADERANTERTGNGDEDIPPVHLGS